MRRTLAVRRVSVVVHARALRNCAREPLQCLMVCAWIQSPRAPHAPYIGALLTSVPASVSLSSRYRTKLCRFSPLCLCTSAPLRLCSALLSVLLWVQHCSRLSSALVSVLLFSLLWSSRSLLCIRFCFAFDSTPRFGSASVSALGSASLVAWPYSISLNFINCKKFLIKYLKFSENPEKICKTFE